MRIIGTIIFILANSFCYSQSFEKSFSGQWAMTSWTFEFYQDGTYKRTSSGHYGNPIYTGNYYIKGDTLEILTGYNNSHGTVNEYYLLDGDSFLVDLDLLYDYKLNVEPWLHNSRKRYDALSKVNMDSVITISRKNFEWGILYCDALISQPFNALFKDDHRYIIRIWNTIMFDATGQFKQPLFQDLLKRLNSSTYKDELIRNFDWVESQGMGYYFQLLQIELMGTPHSWSRYKVVD